MRPAAGGSDPRNAAGIERGDPRRCAAPPVRDRLRAAGRHLSGTEAASPGRRRSTLRWAVYHPDELRTQKWELRAAAITAAADSGDDWPAARASRVRPC